MKMSWRRLTAEQVSLAIARGLDNAPQMPSWKRSGEIIHERAGVDLERYADETVMPMMLITAMTQLFQLLVLVGLIVWAIATPDVSPWMALVAPGFLAVCLIVGRLYIRGYQRVWAAQQGRP